MAKVKPEHYVDNVKFYEEMVQRSKIVQEFLDKNGFATVKEARTAKARFPQISEYAGECILKIGKRLSFHPWFTRYTDSWKEEMIGDGIENCLLYFDNFNPAKTKNPFSYYTQITWYAFRRRIEREKTHQYIKYKTIEMFDNNVTQIGDDKAYKNAMVKFVQQNMGDVIQAFEAKKEANRKKVVKTTKKKKSALGKMLEVSVDDAISTPVENDDPSEIEFLCDCHNHENQVCDICMAITGFETDVEVN